MVALLGLLLVTVIVWRSGMMGHRAAIAADAASAKLAPLSGPPVASPEQIRSTLDRLAAYGKPIMCGGGTKPLVALTFDDGPGPYTRKVVGMLRRAGAKATFFIVAKEIVDWPGLADEPRDEATVGAIGNHTYDHVDLVGITQEQLDHEIVASRELIEEHAGTSVDLFRPPYGHHDAVVDHAVRAQGMLQVLWTVDSEDGMTGATGPIVLHNVVTGLRPGAIVLMHENRGTTLHELPRILHAIRRKGLHTVTVPELLAADPPSASQLRSGSCH